MMSRGNPVSRYLALILLILVLANTQAAAQTGETGEDQNSGGMRIRSGLVTTPAILAVSPTGTDLSHGMPIIQVLPESKAYGILQPGDLIKAVNGKFFNNWASYHAIIKHYFVGQIITVWIIRDGRKMTIEFPLDGLDRPADRAVLTQLLADGGEVRLAVVIGSSENLTIEEPREREEWIANRNRTLLSVEEAGYLAIFSRYENFALVDRSAADARIAEQMLGLSGLVANPTEIGQLLGASHLLQLSLHTAPNGSQPRGFLETITRRLIEVESGRVLASVVLETW